MLANEHYMELETVPNPDGGLIPNPRYKENSDSFLKSEYRPDIVDEYRQGDVNLDTVDAEQVTPVIQKDVSPRVGLPTMNMPVPENFDYSFDNPGEVHEVGADMSQSFPTKDERRAARGTSSFRLDVSVLDNYLEKQYETKSI